MTYLTMNGLLRNLLALTEPSIIIVMKFSIKSGLKREVTEATARHLDVNSAEQLRAGVNRAITTSKAPRPNLTPQRRKVLGSLCQEYPSQQRQHHSRDGKNPEKMTITVNDVCIYCKLSRGPIARIEKKVADHVKRLHHLGYISDKLKDKLPPSYFSSPQMYGLPKVHIKILHSDNCLQHRVTNIQVGKEAMKLARILSSLTGNTESFMKNSTEFVNSICNLEIESFAFSQVFQLIKP